MNHHTVALAMCRITEELLWKPRMAWAAKHNPKARLTIRVGSGNKTYLSHSRDAAMHSVGPVRVKEKRRTKIVVETVEEPKRRWEGYPAGFTTTQP